LPLIVVSKCSYQPALQEQISVLRSGGLENGWPLVRPFLRQKAMAAPGRVKEMVSQKGGCCETLLPRMVE